MNKRAVITSVTGAVAVGIMFSAASPAAAFPIYEDINYGGYAYQAVWASKEGLGTINGKASSMAASPGKTFYESLNFAGRGIYLSGNVANLGQYSTNLGWLQNWNDRIHSYR